jgi:hypothetical protein
LSVIGVWNREAVGLPRDAAPKLVVAAEAVADCVGPYPGMLNKGKCLIADAPESDRRGEVRAESRVLVDELAS